MTGLFSLTVINLSIGQSHKFGMKSPDGRLTMSIQFYGDQEPNKLTYSAYYDEKEVILESALGILSGNADWSSNVDVRKESEQTRDTLWHTVYGERSVVRDHFNEIVISFAGADNPRKRLRIIARAYNEGIAFRYFFPEHPDGGEYLRITEELTTFVMPEGTKGYFTPTAQATYTLMPLEEFPRESERPLTMVLPNGLYACITEAEVVNYSRTKFTTEMAGAPTIRCAMYGQVDEITPFATPWRVVMVAETPGQLLENNYLILNLNPPNKIEDTGWIKPGKVMREVRLSTAAGKALVDFAAERNFQYIEFDAGWYGYEYSATSDATTVTVDPKRNPVNDLDLRAVIDYAKTKDIGAWVYVNQRALTKQLDEILPLYRSWGIKGVKYGFVHVGSHRWTAWLHDAVRKAADHQLMVDIHDEYRPTGFSRTYPNLLTQEGILGNEGFPDASHNLTLPFTRFIAGAGDYTICYYRRDFGGNLKHTDPNRTGGRKVLKTTAAHQLSLAVICYSPLQFMFWYDVPADYQGEPEIEFLENVPTVWDETKVIHGEIGQYITIARRNGEEWFVGTATNEQPRKLDIPLTFLTEGKRYIATVYHDDPKVRTRTKVGIKRSKVRSSGYLKASLAPSGGQAVWIRPADNE